MQVFSEGKAAGWPYIYIKIEYETVRNGVNVGIRWKLSWSIDKYYYFGFNINAAVWTKGTNFGRIIKGAKPNSGSGEAYFPNTTDYLWFDNGYINNNIDGCRIVINSTNGGTIAFDTAPSPEEPDRTLTAPTGYVPSSISSSIDFNIGSNLPITISDVTNIGYNYILNLSVYKEDNTWQQVKTLNTTSKNFSLTLTDIATDLYNLLPTRNSAPIKIDLLTYYGTILIGTTQKAGNCYVVNSNPVVPVFKLFNSALEEITGTTGGFRTI